MVVSDDNSVPYLLDPLKAALDAVHAVGWALRAGIDVELPAGGGYGAHLIEALDYRPSFWRNVSLPSSSGTFRRTGQ